MNRRILIALIFSILLAINAKGYMVNRKDKEKHFKSMTTDTNKNTKETQVIPETGIMTQTKTTTRTTTTKTTIPTILKTTAAVTAKTTSTTPSISTLGTTTTTTTTIKATTKTNVEILEVATTKPSETMPHYMENISNLFEEKAEALGCDLPVLPNKYRIWRGNETHELLLPRVVSTKANHEECNNINQLNEKNEKCPLAWDGDMEIQSGDVLIVKIDDLPLTQNQNYTELDQERFFQESIISVYQVTRNGYDNCDITEGILLDITPLKVDYQKIVTLYDKDLTLGINLLIIVSKLWNNQCIRLKVTVKSDNCGENEDCSGKGLCYSNNSMDGYECQCCLGYIGQHCEEQDACYPGPCKNNGICVDISQGHDGNTFQCLCPYGYTGKICEDQINPCTSIPCQNGASCTGNVSSFHCECPPGFSGNLCQHSRNECESSPCLHGLCVDEDDGYKCFCEPGFTGYRCEYEYNECDSSPCLNGATCTDRIGYYVCNCGRGYTGKRCQIKVDLCEPNPCLEPRFCKDYGNNYTCECPKGYSGSDCLTLSHTACSNNPCHNEGTCWSNENSFYCACKPGYTGNTCQERFETETIYDDNGQNKEKQLNLDMPASADFDHIHSFYIALGTLACAFIIVVFIVTVCYCRFNKTYIHFRLNCRSFRIWRHKIHRPPQTLTSAPNTQWFTGKNKASTATPNRNIPALDTTDMYYTLDFSENQNSPLIQ